MSRDLPYSSITVLPHPHNPGSYTIRFVMPDGRFYVLDGPGVVAGIRAGLKRTELGELIFIEPGQSDA